jgi:hypothetical protein
MDRGLVYRRWQRAEDRLRAYNGSQAVDFPTSNKRLLQGGQPTIFGQASDNLFALEAVTLPTIMGFVASAEVDGSAATVATIGRRCGCR